MPNTVRLHWTGSCWPYYKLFYSSVNETFLLNDSFDNSPQAHIPDFDVVGACLDCCQVPVLAVEGTRSHLNNPLVTRLLCPLSITEELIDFTRSKLTKLHILTVWSLDTLARYWLSKLIPKSFIYSNTFYVISVRVCYAFK